MNTKYNRSPSDDVRATEDSSIEFSPKNEIFAEPPCEFICPKRKEKANKYELSFELKSKLEELPEILEFIKMLQKCIDKQGKKLKKAKKEKIKTKSVSTQTGQEDVNSKLIDKGGEDMMRSVTEEITEAAQQALQHNGFVYEETSGLYYDYNSGYYYNAECGLYYDGNTGRYLKYNQDTNEYDFHSQSEEPVAAESQSKSMTKQKSKKRVKSKQEEPHDDVECAAASKSKKYKVHSPSQEELEEGEWSELSDSSTNCCSENESDLDLTKQYPPCMRIIIEETSIPSLKQGSLHVVTFDGGSIGREGMHTLLLPEINTSKHHAKITFDIEKGSYFLTDVGSRNGTLLNGKRLASAKVESEPHEIPHGSRIQVGSTTLLCHVHAGSQTCGHCEPGLLQMNAEATAVGAATTKCSEHKRQLKQLRKKFGLSQNDQGKTGPGTGYKDRAAQRRATVGSQNPHEKTQTASLTESIASTNMGFKLLSKMGWKEGQALGKDNQGRLEPVELISNPGTSGMGSTSGASVVQPCADVAHDTPRKNVWNKTQERYKQAQLQGSVNSEDIFDLTNV